MNYEKPKNVLVGKIITAIYLADDNEAIKFEIENGEPIIVRVDGDCCSHSWVETIENVEAAIGSEVLVANDLDMNIPNIEDAEYKGEHYELLQFYGFKIETVKGTCKIDYRNSSNGYYGGNLSWPDDTYYYGGVYGQNVSSMNWVKQ